MGYFYVGGKTNQRVNGYGKIGETNQQYLSQRVGKIRQDEGNFFVFKYLWLPDSTQAVTRAIEGYVRMMLERDGWENIQNDHFEWKTTKEEKMNDYLIFANAAIKHAERFCEMMDIPYTTKEGNPSARKTCRHKV